VTAVLVTAVLAFLSKWVLDGGVRRRERATVREELELSKILEGTQEGEELRARALARLEKYLAPTLWQNVVARRHTIIRYAINLVIAVAFMVVGGELKPASLEGFESSAWSVGVGVLIGTAWTVVTAAFRSREVERGTRDRIEQAGELGGEGTLSA
jgi:hypothetical protein